VLVVPCSKCSRWKYQLTFRQTPLCRAELENIWVWWLQGQRRLWKQLPLGADAPNNKHKINNIRLWSCCGHRC